MLSNSLLALGSLLLAARVQADCAGGEYASVASSLSTIESAVSFCSSKYPIPDVTTTVIGAPKNVTVTVATTTLTTTVATTTLTITAAPTTDTATLTTTTDTDTTITTTTTTTATATTTVTVTSREPGNPPAKRDAAAADEAAYTPWADVHHADPVETIRVTVTNTKTFCPSCYAATESPASTWATWSNAHDEEETTRGPSDKTTGKPSTTGHPEDSTTDKTRSTTTSGFTAPFGNTTTSRTTSYSTTSFAHTTVTDKFGNFLSRDSSYVSTVCGCLVTPSTISVTATPTAFSNATLSVTTSVTATDLTTTTPAVTVTTFNTITTTNTATETDTVTTTTTTTVTTTTTQPCSPTLQSDKNNCGACGNKCPTGFGCQNGVCKQPVTCTFSGQIAYCYGGTTCVCYQTTEGRGACADPNAGCGRSCSTSDQCPGNNVCLTTATVGCGSGVGSCSTDRDLSTCPNPGNGFRMFAREGKQSQGRKRPGDDDA